MSKREFLEILKETLSQELPENVVYGHIQYYDQYISDEMRKGVSEADVTGRLGDPRLIAHTILETSEASGSAYQDSYGGQSSGSQSSYNETSYNQSYGSGSSESRQGGFQHVQEKLHHNPTVRLVLGILIVMAVIGLVISVVSALLPIVLPIVVVLVVLSYFRRRM